MTRLTLDHLAAGEACSYMVWCYQRTNFPATHTHAFDELFWVESGHGAHFFNGKEVPLSPGNLVLIRWDDVHCLRATSGREMLQLVNVSFPRGVWQALRRRYFSDVKRFYDIVQPEGRTWQLDPGDLNRTRELAAGLHDGARDRLSIDAFLTGIFSMLAQRPGDRAAATVPDWLRAALERIQYYPNFTGGTAAFVRLCGRSPEHVARMCNAHFGKKPSAIVNAFRMQHAAELLALSDESIAGVALDCGIENLGYFYQRFREHFGSTPAEYRRSRRSLPDRVARAGGRGARSRPVTF